MYHLYGRGIQAGANPGSAVQMVSKQVSFELRTLNSVFLGEFYLRILKDQFDSGDWRFLVAVASRKSN